MAKKVEQKEEPARQDWEEAITAMSELVAGMGLERIVCVDDFFNTTNTEDFETFYGIAMEIGGQDSILSADDVNNVDDEVEVREALRDKWNDYSNPERREMIGTLRAKRAASQSGSQRELSHEERDYSALSSLEKLCHQKVDYFPLSPAEWLLQQQQLLTEASAVKTLFLFDENLNIEIGRKSEGIALMIAAQKAEQAFCGLFSQTFTAEEEPRRWETMRNEHRDIDPLRCVPISKNNLRRRPIEFVRRVKFTALIKPSHELCFKVASVLKDTQDDALDEIRQLSPYEFDHMILRRSYEEGVWEVDAIRRLFNLMQRDKFRPLIKSREEIGALLQEVRRLSDVYTGKLVAPAKLETWRLQALEIYEEASFLNDFHLPIECGDIFRETDTNRQFILLSQPCDLMVREKPKGGRPGERRPGMTRAALVEIVEKSRRPEYYGELPYFREGDPWFVNFGSSFFVPLEVLDMCVFHVEGNASMRLGDSMPPNLLTVWQKRFAILQENLEVLLAKRNTFSRIRNRTARRVAVEMLTESAHISSYGTPVNVDLRNRTITYCLQRVRRLTAVRATAMLAQYSYYLARPAYEADWGTSQG